ncbi:hypothetical protein ACQPYH_28845 [Kribbella sp. CA-245084]|uniref:hypothetical protein n=1 Tax=Kribbella sp. CA-245084 TaxID=3239940 RepID=UPI003D8E60AC
MAIGRMRRLSAFICLAAVAAWLFAVPAQAAVALRERPAGAPVAAVGGNWSAPCSGCIGGKWLLFYSNQSVTLSGKGYFQVRWEVAYFNRVGQLVMPTWTGQTGTLIHVASGGGHRMDDLVPSSATTEPGQTWMGRPSTGYDTLPAGTPMIWQNEFYYLDGTVTLTNKEGSADYNLGVDVKSYTDVYNDINHAPQSGTSWIRYGASYDH